MKKPNKRELVKIGQWLVDGDTGLSSKALCSFFLTASNGGECASRLQAPSDPSDFNRCMKFLECLDKNNRWPLISAIGGVTEGWEKVKEGWMFLVELYEIEKNQSTAPRLFAMMKQIGL